MNWWPALGGLQAFGLSALPSMAFAAQLSQDSLILSTDSLRIGPVKHRQFALIGIALQGFDGFARTATDLATTV
ncbi:MAG: hypothetical protein IPH37_19210 [Burkholderiales bacterium]|nr:hypothetical protein [Burkholderiales bacterium]